MLALCHRILKKLSLAGPTNFKCPKEPKGAMPEEPKPILKSHEGWKAIAKEYQGGCHYDFPQVHHPT